MSSSPECDLCSRRPALLGAYLCQGCHTSGGETLAALAELDRLVDLTGDALALPRRGTGGRRGRPGPTTPTNLDYLVARDRRTRWAAPGDPHAVVGWVDGWLDCLAEDQAAAGIVTFPHRRGTAAEVLSLAWPWITTRPWAADLVVEAREVLAQLGQLLGETEPTIRLGRCPTVVDDDGRCGRILRARASDRVIRCAGCGTTWARLDWPSLAKEMTE